MSYVEFWKLVKDTVILASFWFDIVLNIWGMGSLIIRLIKRVHSGIRKIKNKGATTKTE